MEVNNLIKKVATLLQLTNIVDADLIDITLLSAQTQKDINVIVSCINMAQTDIATDYLPLKTIETITITNGEYEFSSLSKTIYKPVSLGPNVKFKEIENKLIASNGIYDFEYYYLPNEVEVGDSITCFSNCLTADAICFSVCSEYCLIGGNYAESEMWQNKFNNTMLSVCRQVKPISVKQRRWL